MQPQDDLALAKIERAMVEIEMQMTLRVAQIKQLGAELSAAQTILGSLKALLAERDEQRSEIINRKFL